MFFMKNNIFADVVQKGRIFLYKILNIFIKKSVILYQFLFIYENIDSVKVPRKCDISIYITDLFSLYFKKMIIRMVGLKYEL